MYPRRVIRDFEDAASRAEDWAVEGEVGMVKLGRFLFRLCLKIFSPIFRSVSRRQLKQLQYLAFPSRKNRKNRKKNGKLEEGATFSDTNIRVNAQ